MKYGRVEEDSAKVAVIFLKKVVCRRMGMGRLSKKGMFVTFGIAKQAERKNYGMVK